MIHWQPCCFCNVCAVSSISDAFGAGNYQASVKSLDTNNNLYTAASYITTKFRQHDIPGMTSLTELQGTQVLCFQEAIEGKDYCTYIYLMAVI